ncbi:MAG: flagellar hook-associated protein FlgK [Clostridiaceae bacterium]|nr:flagellar hook-associated protein FlgK [Clostridiaceae bacterium]
MGSSFASYEIARSGLYVSQRGLFITGHNISNVNTPGYVRQHLVTSESRPIALGSFQIGIGVSVDQTRQIRNQFLDILYRDESHLLGYAEAQSAVIEDVQAILGEPFSMGLGNAIDQFFQSWHELSKEPDSLAVRALVRERATVLVNMINHIGAQLDKLQEDMNAEIKLTIDMINDIAFKISELNVKIAGVDGTGDIPNDWLDERNNLLDELSKLVDIDVIEKSNGMVDVSVGGVLLVNGSKTTEMVADYNGPQSRFVTAKWKKDNPDEQPLVKLESGTLKGLLDARGNVQGFRGSIENGSLPREVDDVDHDIATDLYVFDPDADDAPKGIIPNLRRGLNILVNVLARKVNQIHSQGSGLDGSTDNLFFTKIDDSLAFEIGNIQINPVFNGDEGLNKIAAARIGGSAGDNTIAQQIIDLRRNNSLFRTKNLLLNMDGYYNALITWIGSVGQESERIVQNQTILMTQIQNKKEAISGVSMDEEMTNIMKYQHAYNASARMINLLDEMIDQIINRMGVVGR